MLDFEDARHLMVEYQLVRRGIKHMGALEAMKRVPRERFVAPGMEDFAYEDSPLPIGDGQTISQPFIVAHMIEAAALDPRDRVLEVGAGSGYAAAVMSLAAKTVVAIERHGKLAEQARARLNALGYDNVSILVGDGSKGWPSEAPFDVIIVSAGGPAIPAALKDQLEIGGRLVIPVGREGRSQRLVRVMRTAANRFEEEDLCGVAFVPLVGEQGWTDETGRVPSLMESSDRDHRGS